MPTPFLTSPGARNIRAALQGIEPNWYRSVDLLPRYNAWAAANGEPEVKAKALGEAINREFQPERRWTHGHVAVWHITSDMLT